MQFVAQPGRILLLSAICLVAGPALGEDWPRWRGPRDDGTWQTPPLAIEWPSGGLPTQWRVSIGAGYAGVVVAGDRVIVLDRQTTPHEVERIKCFSAADGQPEWAHEYSVAYCDLDYGTGPRAAATIDEGRVFTLGAVGHAHCLDLATGGVIWSMDTMLEQGAKLPQWGFAASPVIHGDAVVLHVGADDDGCYLALDKQTGRVLWRGGTDPAGYATPRIVQRPWGSLLVGWTPEHVMGLDASTGAVLWTLPYKVTYGVSIAMPIVRGDMVFVTGYWEGSKAIRLGNKPGDAALAWEDDKELRGLMSQPLYRQDHVYSLDKSRGLTCFELLTGKVAWTDGHRLTPRGRNPQVTMVWVGDTDQTLNLNSEGELVLARFAPAGYEELARTSIIDPTWAHPAYANGYVFARSDTQLVCVKLPLAEVPVGGD